MRQLFLAAAAAVALAGLGAGPALAGKVEIKQAHVCCGQCEKGATAVLAKVDGVSDAAADKTSKTITFTTKDDKTTAAALKALADAGFYGAATDDGKEVKIDVAAPKKGDKADEVTVKDIHLCCPRCKATVQMLFKDATVDFPDKNQAKITGKALDKAEVLETLHKAGFNGKIE